MRRLPALGAALAAAALAMHPAAAAAAPACPGLAYIQTMEAANAAVERTPPDVEATLGLITHAVAADPGVTEVLQPVIDDLQVRPAAVADARSRLAALAGVLAVPPRSTCAVDSTPAERTLHGVYASPAFAALDQRPQQSLLQQIGSAITTVVSRIFNALGPGGSTALGVAVLLALAALVAWRVRASLGGKVVSVAEVPEAGDDPRAEWSAALAAAKAGAYREAVRRAFRSALLEVAGRGRLRVDAAWTTRELLDGARGDAELLAALAASADCFDRAWYSGRTVSAADWELARSRCELVRRLAQRPAPVATP